MSNNNIPEKIATGTGIVLGLVAIGQHPVKFCIFILLVVASMIWNEYRDPRPAWAIEHGLEMCQTIRDRNPQLSKDDHFIRGCILP
jgi:hypothetical protein